MKQGKFKVMQSAESNEHLDIYYVAGDVPASEINEAVYAVFCVVGQAVLDRSKCFISGDRTAAEIAGTLGSKWVKALIPLTDEYHKMASSVQIVVGEGPYTKTHKPAFTCVFPTDTVFEQMAEWEGVMSLPKNKQHTFGCECCQDSFKNVPLKPYTRCRQPKATNPYSAAQEAARINKKFEVIGELRRRLSPEGMRKALSVLAAARQWQNPQKYRMALEVMRRRLWKDYGTDQYAGPMPYDDKDFEYGPEIWKQVDTAYADMLRRLFCDMLNAAPAPKWIHVKDYVQVKDKENLIEKLHGRLYVTNVYARLDGTGEKFVWMANVVAAKGREWQFEVDRLEPWKEPVKPKKGDRKQAAGKDCARPAAKTKASPRPVKAEAPVTVEDRLRAALREQLAMAA